MSYSGQFVLRELSLFEVEAAIEFLVHAGLYLQVLDVVLFGWGVEHKGYVVLVALLGDAERDSDVAFDF